MSKLFKRGLILALALVLVMGLVVTANAGETEDLALLDGNYTASMYGMMKYKVSFTPNADPKTGAVVLKTANDDVIAETTYEYAEGNITVASPAFLLRIKNGALEIKGQKTGIAYDYAYLPMVKEAGEGGNVLVLGENAIDVPAGYTGVNYTFTATEPGDYVLSLADGETNAWVNYGNDSGVTLPLTIPMEANDKIEINVSADDASADTINLMWEKAGAQEATPAVTYDFADLAADGKDLEDPKSVFTAGASVEHDFEVAISKVYAGNNGTSGVFQKVPGYLKLGTSSKKGQIVLTYAEGSTITKVEVYCHAWTAGGSDKISVNGSEEKTMPNEGAAEMLTFELDGTSNKVTIDTNKRGFISKIVVYGTLTEAPAEDVWTVIGDIEDTAWQKDFEMTKQENGTWKSTAAFAMEAGTQLKCRANAAWDIQAGGNGPDGNYVVAEAGIYYVIVDPATKTITLEEVPAVGGPDTIADALAGEAGTEFTVLGEILFIDGKTVYVQDETGAIALYFTTAPEGWAVGGTVQATGAKKVFKSLPELDGCVVADTTYTAGTATATPVAGGIEIIKAENLCKLVTLSGEFTVKSVKVSSSNGAVTVVIESGDKTVTLYKVPTSYELAVGDKVTSVSGVLSTYDGLQILPSSVTFTPGEVEIPEVDPTGMTEAEIVDAAYTLVPGQAMVKPATLTGVITEVDEEGYSEQFKNITVTIQVGDKADKKIVCFRLKGDEAADLVVGDTIKVEGTIVNYNGIIEFDAGCKLLERTPAQGSAPTGDNSGIFMLMAIMTISMGAVLVLGKKVAR